MDDAFDEPMPTDGPDSAVDFITPEVTQQVTPEVSVDEIVISDEQWQKIKNLWNSRPKTPPSLMELGKLVFNKDDLDGRTKEGRAIRKRLAEANLKARTVRDREGFELTEEQKEYIKNNPKEKVTDIARTLFKNPSLSNLSSEARAVADYVKSLNRQNSIVNDVPEEREYKPPQSVEGVLRKINKYRPNEPLDKEKLSGKQQKDMRALLDFLQVPRFVMTMNSYEKQSDRELLESTFIRYTYDKHDLNQEDVEQYLNLSLEAVIAVNIRKRIEQLRKLLDESTEDGDEDERKKVSMALVEAIGKTETEYHQSIQRQNKMANDLRTKRSERDDERKKGAASMLNLIALWKDDKERKFLIEEAQERKQENKEEIERISAMDRFKGAMYGMTSNEVFNA